MDGMLNARLRQDWAGMKILAHKYVHIMLYPTPSQFPNVGAKPTPNK
jgi:hypothetical protein